jgi:translation initiation factor IF-3
MRKHILNERIKGSTIRLVGHEKFANDIVNTRDALNLAREEGLDLVLINPKESPVICKIMDYNKFVYNQKKVDKKNNNAPKLKEVKFTPNISDNDLNVKIKQARKFLEKGSPVKVEVFFKGREITHKDIGKETLFKFLNELVDVGTFSLDVVFKGKRIIHHIRPKK